MGGDRHWFSWTVCSSAFLYPNCLITYNTYFWFILQKQIKEAGDFLANEMGQMVNRASRDKIPINLSKDEIQTYIKRFQIIDKDRKGFVSINDIRRSLKVYF